VKTIAVEVVTSRPDVAGEYRLPDGDLRGH